MLDLSFINPFVMGAVQAFVVQGKLTVEIEKPFIKGKASMPSISISSQIPLVSNIFRGRLTLAFEEKVYTKIMSGMLGVEIREIAPENQDGASEFLNLTYGFAKMQLNPQGHNFNRALPVLRRGKDLQLDLGDVPTLVVPLKTDHGYAFVEFAVEAMERK